MHTAGVADPEVRSSSSSSSLSMACSVVRLWACSVLGLWTRVNRTDSHWRSCGVDLAELRDTGRDIRIRI